MLGLGTEERQRITDAKENVGGEGRRNRCVKNLKRETL